MRVSPADHAVGQPPPGTSPCEGSPPPMPCCASGAGSFCTCGAGSLDPPPPLGGGDDSTGSLAGWVGAGVSFCVVGARASEGSLTPPAGVTGFFSGAFVF